MNRRDMMKAAPVALCAATVSTAAFTAETPIMALFREWQHLEAYSRSPDLSDNELEAATEKALALEDLMMDLPSQTMQDMAAKICAFTSFGVFALTDGVAPEFWAEAHLLLGSTA